MKKLSIVFQWAVVLTAAGWLIYGFTRPSPDPVVHRDTWSQWEGFHVLAYPGIARDPDNHLVSHDLLSQHIAALDEAGFETITPADIKAYLAGEHPLPEKAVMLVFEGGRKDTFLWPTPMLRRHAMRAVLAVPMHVVRRWGTYFLRYQDLEKAVKSPYWTLASMGTHADDFVKNAKGEKLPALTARTPGEDDEAYAARLREDVGGAAEALTGLAGQPVDVFIFPQGADGTNRGADPLAADLIRQTVQAHHGLAFTGTEHSFNGRGADPFRLSRLVVHGTMTSEEIIDELTSFAPRTTAVTTIEVPGDWRLANTAHHTGSSLVLGFDGEAWLRGTEAWRDLKLRASIKRAPGSLVSVLVRYSSPEHYLRLTISDTALQLQERIEGRFQTLMRHPLDPTSAPETQRVALVVKGKRLWTQWDERPLSGPFPLTSSCSIGAVGLTSRNGVSTFTAFEAEPLPSHYALGVSFSELPESDRASTSVLVVDAWSTKEAPSVDPVFRQDVLQASANGIEVVPLVDNSGETSSDTTAWAAALDNLLRSTNSLTPVSRIALRGNQPELRRLLRAAGWPLVHLVGPGDVPALLETEGALGEEDQVLLLAPPAQREQSLNTLVRHIPSNRVLSGPIPGKENESRLRALVSYPRASGEVTP